MKPALEMLERPFSWKVNRHTKVECLTILPGRQLQELLRSFSSQSIVIFVPVSSLHFVPLHEATSDCMDCFIAPRTKACTTTVRRRLSSKAVVNRLQKKCFETNAYHLINDGPTLGG